MARLSVSGNAAGFRIQSRTMNVTINGKTETLAEEKTVTDLLERLKLAPIRVAVEINEELVSRRDFSETTIHDGDRIEVVTFVGGG